MKKFKVVGLISSPRYDGNTAVLVREALKGAEKGGAAVEEVFLPRCTINFCTGCFKCLADGKCCFNDDFEEVRELLYEAEGIILGSPTYCRTYNATMKNFFERLGMFEVMTSSLGGKYFAGISAAGSAMTAKKTAGEMASLISSGVFKRSYVSGVLGAGFVKGMPAHEDREALRKARELGSKISRDIRNEKRYLLQKPFIRLVNNFFIKPQFINYVSREKERDTRAVYANLLQRGLLQQ